MASNVLFKRGPSSGFNPEAADSNTLYFLTDTKEIYLGGGKYGFGNGIKVTVSGEGDTVQNVAYDANTNSLQILKGDAADAQSIHDLLDSALASFVKEIKTDADSAIVVDSTQAQFPKLSLNIAENQHKGNVTLGQCSDGLFANVDIPDTPIDVDPDDKVLKVENSVLSSTLSITTEKQDDVSYVVLKGIDGVEISKFDASDFVKDGMLDSVRLETDQQGHRILVFVFNTDAGKESIRVDVGDIISAYTAGAGIDITDDTISIDNAVDPEPTPINTDVAPDFGEEITLNAVKYNAQGLITGKGSFKFKMPSIVGGSVGTQGSADTLITYLGVATDGELTGETIAISDALSAASTDQQIPTAKAVYDAIEDARPVWDTWDE